MSELAVDRAPVSLGVLGAGRAATAVARALQNAGIANVEVVCNRSVASAKRARDMMVAKSAIACDRLPAQSCSTWLIGVADDALEEAGARLRPLRPELVFHLSGSRSAEVLSSSCATHLASAHPLMTFVRGDESIVETPIGVEAEQGVAERLGRWFKAAGASPFRLHSEAKLLYHAAAVCASNHFFGLFHLCDRLFEAGNVAIDRRACAALSRAALENALQSPRNLTGPVARGEADTLARQLEAVPGRYREAYRQLCLLDLESVEAVLSFDQKTRVKKALGE